MADSNPFSITVLVVESNAFSITVTEPSTAPGGTAATSGKTRILVSPQLPNFSSGNPDLDRAINRMLVEFVSHNFDDHQHLNQQSSIASDTEDHIEDATAAVNVAGKETGTLIWDITNKRMMRAAGSAPTDAWDAVDGSESVTPS